MSVLRPRDLSELRLRLLQRWSLGGAYTAMAVTSLLDPVLSGEQFAHLEAKFDEELLRQGELWWVDRDMCELVAHAAMSLPPTTLTEDLVPSRPVVAYFEKALVGSDALTEGLQFEVQIIGWAPTNHLRFVEADKVLTISMYGPSPVPDLDLWPLGRTDWLYGEDTEEPSFPTRDDPADVLRAKSMAEDRRWLAALLLLSSQPLASSRVVGEHNKARKRRLEKAGVSSDVRVVGLRQSEETSGSAAGPSGRRWGHRTIVGAETGGFWKQVAYGPGRSLRRPRWIFPYEAGPADKPLILKDTVKVVKADPKP